MSNIKGTIVNIKDFISNRLVDIKIQNSESEEVVFKLDANRSYRIPDFQREIRWSRDNLYELMSDINSGAKFLGNVILTKQSNRIFDIIDGQQRISLLFMLVYYINKKYHDEISIDYEFCDLQNASFGKYSEFVKNDYSIIGLTNSQANIIAESDKLGQIERFQELWEAISQNDILADSSKAVIFLKNIERCEVNVILSDQDSTNYSIEYFLDVNLKGVRLDDEDIFKGYLFYLDTSQKIRDLWVKLKQKSRLFNNMCFKKSGVKRECYPLMKMIEHFFYCDLYSDERYKDIQFNEDFRLKEKILIGSTYHYSGEHILKVINNVGYMQRSIEKMIKILDIANNIVSNESPNDAFKTLFLANNGKKVLDEDEIKIFFQYYKNILLDRTMVVSKAVLIKYLISVVLSPGEKKKEDYRKIYLTFMFSTMFAIFENKKGIEPIAKILKAQDWYVEMMGALLDFLNPASIKTRRRGAEFRFSTNPENEEQRYHSIMLVAVYNYFEIAGETVRVKTGKLKALSLFLTDTKEFSVEHFIVNNGKKCVIPIQETTEEYEYEYTLETKKYAASIFNYIYIKDSINNELGRYIVQEKIIKLDSESVNCEYSRMVLDAARASFLAINFVET